MTNLDATTPQLRAIKGIADAYTSRDLKGLEPILSRDFIFKTFPKSSEFPDLTKEEYIQRYGLVTALLAGVEVRIKHFSNSEPTFTNSQLVFHEVIEAQGKAVTNVRPSPRCHLAQIMIHGYAGYILVYDHRRHYDRLRFSHHLHFRRRRWRSQGPRGQRLL